jgi:uncharacterized protein with GYD domain
MKGADMASYVTLIKFTERGAKHIKDTCKRAADFKANVKKMGIDVKEQYWCSGTWDGIILYDAPSDEIASAGMLYLSSLDNVATQTMRSFSAAEMTKILAAIP